LGSLVENWEGGFVEVGWERSGRVGEKGGRRREVV
jgi:hypothetical protein